jgi:cytidylate kinase
MNIAIDGPSGAGKSSLAKAIAKELGIIYVDTGALYRTIGLYMKAHGVDPHDAAAVTAALPGVELTLAFENGAQHIYLCGEDVGESIRTPEMSLYASAVSAIMEVRAFLLDTQRRVARSNSVVMDGRDIGTVILPDAAPMLVKKGELSAITARTELPESLDAPVEQGQQLGELILEREGERIAALPLTAGEDVLRLTWPDLFARLLSRVAMGGDGS